MQIPWAAFSAVYCDGFIYAVGSESSSTMCTKHVERYNPDKNKWSEVASMNIARRGLAAAAVHGKIVGVVGRNLNSETVREIDCYDPAGNTWNIIGKTNHDFAYHGLVVI